MMDSYYYLLKRFFFLDLVYPRDLKVGYEWIDRDFFIIVE